MAKQESILHVDKKLELPELGLPLAYTIPHAWGGLHVTESAHKAYEIVPLSPHVIQCGAITDKDEQPQVDIMLIGPDEIEISGGAAFARSKVYSRGIGIAIGFPYDNDWLAHRLRSSLEATHALLGIAPANVERELVDEDGLPTIETLKNSAPQHTVQSILSMVEDVSTASITDWIRQRNTNRQYRKIIKTGAMGLAFAGAICTADIALYNTVTTRTAAEAGAFLSVYALYGRYLLRHMIIDEPNRYELSRLQAHETAKNIATDIHADLSSAYFDMTSQALFGDGNHPLPGTES